jgi:PPK2 family polyphosphate:nucleotide phosphotransferase
MTNLDHSQFVVTPGSTVDLAAIDPSSTGSFTGGKAEGRAAHDVLNSRLEDLQELLYAQGTHRLLVVLQATDTGGKDGTIRSVFDGVNPQGVKVASFKRPTERELSHDYLWRVHPHVPGNGEIVIFNRSHYEDVLVVRVRGLAPEERWSKRYRHINDFECMLADEGTTIVKLFLHISKDEQRERLQARLDDPTKHWKFSRGDLEERNHWDDYQAAFATMLSETSTDWAPWHVIPADRKWFRDLLVSTILVRTLESFGMSYPRNEEDLTGVVVE